MTEFNPIEFESKWQAKWSDANAFHSDYAPGQEKFFIIFAYPGISGYLHVGHMRGFTYADVLARYHRMQGRSVLFPAGFHASGLPATSLAKRVARQDEKTMTYLRKNGCPEDVLAKLGDTDQVIKYFSGVYVEDYWKKFGFTIDYQRAMTTISPGYQKFIQWQFHKLEERNLLVHKPHVAPFCPNCGPIAVDASMTDVSKGGNAQILEFTALKFKDDEGNIWPAATLRPETVFGVTNMWLNPNVKYQKIKIGDETWIVSPEAAQKLSFQRDNVEMLEQIQGTDLIGGELTVPVTEKKVLILPGDFVDPAVATGVVMSVPTHAPFDWAALLDAQKVAEDLQSQYGIDPEAVRSIEVITLIHTSKSKSDNPARDICDRLGVKSQTDHDLLEQATQEIYKDEFHSGVLNDACGEYAGTRVSQVKDTLREDFIYKGVATPFHEFSEQVVCRCDTPVVIKKVPKQWFIKYSDEDLTWKTKDHAEMMNIVPKEYYNEMPNVLDWFSDRACIRQGSWLGTEFPFEENWIIEPISDSTLYPTYYIPSKYVNKGKLDPSEMDNRFFDYIFLGMGNPTEWGVGDDKVELYNQIKADFDYWYPLDINLGGKEHKTVHFPVFLMNHCAILPGNKWPRGIFVNWWVTMTGGEKIAKSKGGAEPIPEAIEKYGVDAMRLYYCHVGSAHLDIEWEQKIVLHYRSRLRKIWDMVHDALENEADVENEIDQWLISKFNEHRTKVLKFLSEMDIRNAANEVYFNIYHTFSWYNKRGGQNTKILKKMYAEWIKTMAPITPHVAEELWERIGGEGLVSTTEIPAAGEVDKKVLVQEGYVVDLLDDIRNIMGLLKDKPSKAILYTTPQWKVDVLNEVLSIKRDDPEAKKFDMGAVIKKFMGTPGMEPYREDIPKFVGTLTKMFASITPVELEQKSIQFDEFDYIASAKEFLEKELECPVEVYRADGEDIPDPQGKSKQAQPLRPAILVQT